MMVLKTGVRVLLVLQVFATLCSSYGGSHVLSPECNNHGTLLSTGHCRCHDKWYGRKCQHIKNAASGSSGHTSGFIGSHTLDSQCNNHGMLLHDGTCHCTGKWFGRKCELLRNFGHTTPPVPEAECNNHGARNPNGRCRCYDNWYGRKCERIGRSPFGQVTGKQATMTPVPPKIQVTNHGGLSPSYLSPVRTSPRQYLATQSFFATVNKTTTTPTTSPYPSPVATTPTVPPTPAATTSTALPTPAATTSTALPTPAATTPTAPPTPAATTPTALPTPAATTPTAPPTPAATSPTVPPSPAATTPTVPPTPAAKTHTVPSIPAATTPTMTSTTSPTTSTVSSTPAATTSTLSSTTSTTPTMLATTDAADTVTSSTPSFMKPNKMSGSNTTLMQLPFSSNGSTTILAPTKLASVTTSKPGRPSTQAAVMTLPPISTECAVCSGPAFLCEKLFASTKCHPPNNYCLNTIVNHKDGTRSVNRTCGNFDSCYREWYQGSSDSDKCRKFNGNEEQHLDFQCTFCCIEDNCNIPLHPADNTLYIPV